MQIDFATLCDGEEFVGKKVDAWILSVVGNDRHADPGRVCGACRENHQDLAAILSEGLGLKLFGQHSAEATE